MKILDIVPIEWVNTILTELREPPFLEVLNKYAGTKNVFVSYRDIPKLGLNPKNIYGTPIGIYSYPLEYVIKQRGSVPYASDRPYVWIFQWNGRGRLLTDGYSETEYHNDLVKLKTIYTSYVQKYENDYDQKYGDDISSNETVLAELFDTFARRAEHEAFVKIPLGFLWNLTRLLAQNAGRKTETLWSWLFVQLGIAGVNDKHGAGIIHTSEPTQAVFFNPASIQILRRYDVRRLRIHPRSTLPDQGMVFNTDYQWGIAAAKNPSVLTTLDLTPDEQAEFVRDHPDAILKMRNPSRKAIAALFDNGTAIDGKIAAWLVHRDPRYAPKILASLSWQDLTPLITLRKYLDQATVDAIFSRWSHRNSRVLEDLVDTFNKINVRPSDPLIVRAILEYDHYDLLVSYPDIIKKNSELNLVVSQNPAIARYALLSGDYPVTKLSPASVALIVADHPSIQYVNRSPVRLTPDQLQTVRDNIKGQIERDPALQFNYIFGDRVFNNNPQQSIGEAAGLIHKLGVTLDPKIQDHIIQDGSNIIGAMTPENYAETVAVPDYELKLIRLLLFQNRLSSPYRERARVLMTQYSVLFNQNEQQTQQTTGGEPAHAYNNTNIMKAAGFYETASFGGPVTFTSPRYQVFFQFPEGIDDPHWVLMSEDGKQTLNSGWDPASLQDLLKRLA